MTARDLRHGGTAAIRSLNGTFRHGNAHCGCGSHAETAAPSPEAELRHRLRNLLALVQVLVKASARGATDVHAMRDDLLARIEALACAEAAGLELEPGQADEEITLGALAARLLRPYAGERIAAEGWLRGPELRLAAGTAPVVALVLHELVANAAKHGALSVAGGRVDVSWELGAEGRPALFWRERGGPAPDPAAERRRGFGSRLLAAAVEGQLGGSLACDFASGGLTVRLELGPETLAAAPQAGPADPPQELACAAGAGSQADLAGATVLVVEDDPIIAMDCGDMLRRFGAGRVLCCDTAAEAQRLAAREAPALVLVDLSLRGDDAHGALPALGDRGAAVLVMTGRLESAEALGIPEFPLLRKPFSEGALEAAVNAALEAARARRGRGSPAGNRGRAAQLSTS